MDLSSHTITNTPSFGMNGLYFTARLVDVHDGDTVTVIAEVFPTRVFKFNVRLIGIDAPEMTSRTPEVKMMAEATRMRLVSLLTNENCDVATTEHLTRSQMIHLLQQQTHLVYIRCKMMDKYGRVLAEIARDEHLPHAGLVLLREGLVRPYEGGTKDSFE